MLDGSARFTHLSVWARGGSSFELNLESSYDPHLIRNETLCRLSSRLSNTVHALLALPPLRPSQELAFNAEKCRTLYQLPGERTIFVAYIFLGGVPSTGTPNTGRTFANGCLDQAMAGFLSPRPTIEVHW